MLSDAKIRAAQARPKPYKLFDAQRLYVFVTPKGAKLWRMNYEYDGKHKSLSLGAYPGLGLLAARSKAEDARRLLAEGRDPAVAKKLAIRANIEASRNTFEKIAREWWENSKPQWAKVHAYDVLRSLERDVFPAIGTMPLHDLTPPEIVKVLRAIEQRSAIETAKRTRQRISAVFVYAIASGLAQYDPAEKVGAALKPLPRKGRQPAITDIVKLRKVLDDVDKDDARPVTRLALRLLALTAVRPGELRGAEWSEFEGLDDKTPIWRIPTARMKGNLDRKEEEGGDHIVPLVPESVAVLRAAWKLNGRAKLVFPSTRHIHRPMSENALGYLLNRAGYHGRHVPHGFRAAFSTIMNEWAKTHGRADDRAVIDLMLAHVPTNKIEGAYNRAAYLPRRRELAQTWARMLVTGLLTPDELLPLPARHNLIRETDGEKWPDSSALRVA